MQKRTVLIAENNGIISLDIKTLLESNNYKPVIVRSAKDLLIRYRRAKPDLIIADLNLGKESTEDALREINNIDSTPIIIVSGSTRSRLEQLSGNLSHCTYLPKPFDEMELLEVIKKYLKS